MKYSEENRIGRKIPVVGEVYEFDYQVDGAKTTETFRVVEVTETHVYYKFPESRHIHPMHIGRNMTRFTQARHAKDIPQ